MIMAYGSKKVFGFFFLFIWSAQDAYSSQNIVQNGGFETVTCGGTGKPADVFSQGCIPGWLNSDADLFAVQAATDTFTSAKASLGHNNYAGLAAIWTSHEDIISAKTAQYYLDSLNQNGGSRDALIGTLVTPLTQFIKYTVSMKLKDATEEDMSWNTAQYGPWDGTTFNNGWNAYQSNIAVGNIELGFSNTASAQWSSSLGWWGVDANSVSQYTPAVTTGPSPVLPSATWNTFNNFSYIAHGGEQSLTISRNDSATQSIPAGSIQLEAGVLPSDQVYMASAYYFVDDVSVTCNTSVNYSLTQNSSQQWIANAGAGNDNTQGFRFRFQAYLADGTPAGAPIYSAWNSVPSPFHSGQFPASINLDNATPGLQAILDNTCGYVEVYVESFCDKINGSPDIQAQRITTIQTHPLVACASVSFATNLDCTERGIILTANNLSATAALGQWSVVPVNPSGPAISAKTPVAIVANGTSTIDLTDQNNQNNLFPTFIPKAGTTYQFVFTSTSLANGSQDTVTSSTFTVPTTTCPSASADQYSFSCVTEGGVSLTGGSTYDAPVFGLWSIQELDSITNLVTGSSTDSQMILTLPPSPQSHSIEEIFHSYPFESGKKYRISFTTYDSATADANYPNGRTSTVTLADIKVDQPDINIRVSGPQLGGSNGFAFNVNTTNTFSVEGAGAPISSYLWNFIGTTPEEGTDSQETRTWNDSSPDNASNHFEANVKITYSNQCWAQTKKSVTIQKFAAYIPNAFSPNGDGVDDVEYIFGTFDKLISFKIFNRIGELVFETSDKNQGWDGTYKGVLQNPGVFVYEAEVIPEFSSNDTPHAMYKGSLTLVR